jgi:glycolate oxidase subunit GlcD
LPARAELARLLPEGTVVEPSAHHLHDATEAQGLAGHADAVALPETTAEVATVVAWCYEHDVAIVPRGGGTGYAGGAVPDGGVVLSLERMRAVRALDAPLWRAHVEAGLPTAQLQRVARENGLWFPPDPGAAEQSQLGGNIATNAGGPHAFKYGVTGRWVTGIEAVVPPGEAITAGGPVRKDAAGYDLRGLLVGSEGTLGVITAAWLRLIPAPEAALPVAALYADTGAGCAAVEAVMAAGVPAAALEFLDAGAIRVAGGAFPVPLPDNAQFMVVAEADGSLDEARRVRAELTEVLAPAALTLHAPETRADVAALWRWRDGVSLAVASAHGGKVSEDIAIPVEHLREAIEATLEIGARHDLAACSWGHAGDGNLHSTFMLDRSDPAALARADRAAGELFALALRTGGSISGEHGVGTVKRGALREALGDRGLALHRGIKHAFDPKGLMNPGKLVP